MTSTADTTQHPDVTEISDLAEGLLSPSRTGYVRRHLTDCALCTDIRNSLDEIRGLLGTVPGPRMPSEVISRIDAAVAAAALLDTTASNEPPHVSRETAASGDTETGPSNPPEPRTDRPSGHARGARGPGRGSRTGRHRHRAVIGAVVGTAAVGVTVLLLQSSFRTSGDQNATERASSKISSSADRSDDLSETHLQARVNALLNGVAPQNRGAAGQGPSATGDLSGADAPMAASVPPIPLCVQQGTGRSDPVLAAEAGMYKDRKAFLLVLPASSDGSRVQAYVIDAACADAAPATRGKVLLTDTYPRR